MRRLERPDALREPVEQLQPVGVVAEEHLAEVHVRLHQPGNDGAARAVDDLRAARRLEASDAVDAAVRDQHVGALDAAARVHGQDGAAAQNDHSASRRRTSTFPATRLR